MQSKAVKFQIQAMINYNNRWKKIEDNTFSIKSQSKTEAKKGQIRVKNLKLLQFYIDIISHRHIVNISRKLFFFFMRQIKSKFMKKVLLIFYVFETKKYFPLNIRKIFCVYL